MIVFFSACVLSASQDKIHVRVSSETIREQNEIEKYEKLPPGESYTLLILHIEIENKGLKPIKELMVSIPTENEAQYSRSSALPGSKKLYPKRIAGPYIFRFVFKGEYSEKEIQVFMKQLQANVSYQEEGGKKNKKISIRNLIDSQ